VAFEGLSEKLSGVFKRLRAKGKLSEKDVKEAMREVKLALLAADVNYKVAKDFTDRVLASSVGEKVMESLTPGQMVVKIVNEELCSLMGESETRLEISSKPPTIVMLCGLQGSGKTTHAAKLALLQKKGGHRPLLVACDVYRPAAITQLQVLGSKIDVPVFEMGNKDPVKIAKSAVSHAKDYGNDIVILDTAGRLHIDEELMNELKKIKSEVAPTEILLVVDSMTGQDAVNVAKSFDDLLNITGVIITKLDGDTRGGAALSIRAVTGKPIKFAGVGEKLENLELFNPDRMASRILDMGDVLTLIEEAKSKLDHREAEQFAHKLMNNKLDFNDLLSQFSQIKKMGPLKSILSKFPGMQKQVDNINIDDKQIDRMCALISSMTPNEREKPHIIDFSRKKRIAKGSGMQVEDLNKLLKMLEGMQKMMKRFNPKGKKRKINRLPGLGGSPL
jgi:signal recognition particle subunit SRP54